MEHEEDISCDLMTYSEICEDIRRIMTKVGELKSNTGKSDDKKQEITELRMQGSFNFLNLKQLNRGAQIRCKSVKDRTLEAKQKLDGYNLQLENLQYEISHLHKEITKCLEFKSRHDDIQLVPVEEFYRKAPSEISNSVQTKSDVHKQTLARLDFELEQRKQLASEFEELKKQRESVTDEIRIKKQNLQTLGPALQNLLKSSLPLQDALNLPFDYMKKQNDLAKLLPRPLFVLYLQASGYQEACDPLVTVSIDGDGEMAKKYKELNESLPKVKGVSVEGEDSDSDQEEIDDQDSGRSRHRKKEKIVPMDEDSSIFTGVSASHPLTININLKISNDGPTLRLTFSYLTTLKFVMVKSRMKFSSGSPDSLKRASSLLNEDILLCCATSNDFGLHSPNPSASFLLQNASLRLSDLFSKLGKPYGWAQNLCGLVFLSKQNACNGEDMQISFNHIQSTITALRRKVKSRISLAKQVDQFSNKVVQYSGSKIIDLPKKVHSSLTSWTEISYSDYKKLSYTGSVIDLGILGTDEEALCHNYFVASIGRGSTVKLDAGIVIFSDYPNSIPLVTLSLQWKGVKTAATDQNLQEMERELNIEWPPAAKSNYIVTLMLQRLMMMLDLYLEIECDNDSTSSEFTLSKVCPHKTIGPARLKPFLYKPASNSYVHRGIED